MMLSNVMENTNVVSGGRLPPYFLGMKRLLLDRNWNCFERSCFIHLSYDDAYYFVVKVPFASEFFPLVVAHVCHPMLLDCEKYATNLHF
jgi:hypothetical protein